MSRREEPPDARVDRFGKYELIDRLGRGGMADVWRARVAGPQGFARVLVLKRILPHLVEDPKARQLFEREARVISRLSHANVVKVFEFGEVGGEYYLTMEYVEGRDFAAVIRSGGASPGLAALVMRDVCRALSYAYTVTDDAGTPLRILHRDISPSNIMIGFDGGVRLLDFGIAKALSDPRDKRTVKGTIRGKFGYIAPEVIDGLDPDARADLFSVGVVLHETLSGKRLFRGASDLETLALVKRADVPRPSSLNPAVPPALDAICMRALERDRERRYDDGDHMAEALDEVVHELRFGPSQLTEVMGATFPGQEGARPALMEDSGPRTVQEGSSSDVGFGTARSVEIDADERPTAPMSTALAEQIERDSRATAPERPSVRDLREFVRAESTPDAVAAAPVTPPSPSPSAPEPKKPSAAPAPKIEVPPRDPPAAVPRRGGALYLVGGVLAGGVVTGLLLLARGSGSKTPPGPPPPPPSLGAADLAPRTAVDLATTGATELVFPNDDFPSEPPGKQRGHDGGTRPHHGHRGQETKDPPLPKR